LSAAHVESTKVVGSKFGINKQGHERNVLDGGCEKEGVSGH